MTTEETFSRRILAAVAGVLFAAHSLADGGHQTYTPIDGGYEITDGVSEFNRPLYGWHGNDWKKTLRLFALTSDRPKVRLESNPGRRPLGILSFGDGRGSVKFRYVRGRAEYEIGGNGTVRLVRSAESEDVLAEVVGDIAPKFDGEWIERGRTAKDGKMYYAFSVKGGEDAAPKDLPKAFADAVARLDALSRSVVVRTPVKEIDSLVACDNIAADGVKEGVCYGHAALTWRDPFPGWRVGYMPTALGRDEEFKAFAREHFKSQNQDGRVTSKTGLRDSIYSFNEPFFDAVMRYWLRTGDDAFMRECAYDATKRHLAYMDKYIKVPGSVLYENFLNAWNTDNKWTNGGESTIASAYVRFACRTMARIAGRLGFRDDAEAFTKKADAIDAAIDKSLWDDKGGVWGEYRERFGHRRLVPPDSSSIYTAIDSGLADAHPERARRALGWFARNVPSLVAKDGTPISFSSNKLPCFYSTCGTYPEENMHLALACWQAGEPELAWRHYRSGWFQASRGVKAGPGVMGCALDRVTFENWGDIDFTDSISMFLRSTVEGLFGIRIDGPTRTAKVAPGFPAEWNEAEIKTPYFGYRWTRSGGVVVTHNPNGYKVEACGAKPESSDLMPRPHGHWGFPKGEGCDMPVPVGAEFKFVDLAPSANQDLRTLHSRTYTPIPVRRFPWCTWGPTTRSVEHNGRSWWNEHYAAERHRSSVPDKLRIPADGVVRTKTGIPFRIGPDGGKNAVFASLYDQFPAKVSLPLSGRASKLALLVAVSSNPNVDWVEAARIEVVYADGSMEALSLVPPDNCDDWLNYSVETPYHLNGEHVMLHDRAHLNAVSLSIDPSKDLKSVSIECTGTETLAGIAAATLVGCGLRAATPAPRHEGWWMKRHAERLAAAVKTQPKVVFIGDSITAFWANNHQGVRGRAQLAKYFSEGERRAHILGCSGDTTENVLWRIENGELDGYEAKCVVLMIGTNNTGRGDPPSDVILGVREILKKIREKQPKSVVVLCAIFPRGADARYPMRVRNDVVNQEIQKLCDGKNVFWCDFTDRFLTGDGRLPRTMFPDLLHPGPAGYEIWSAAIKPYVDYALSDGTLPVPSNLYPARLALPALPVPVAAQPVARIPGEGYGDYGWWLDRMLVKRVEIEKSGGSFDLVFLGDSITHQWEEERWSGNALKRLRKTYSVLDLGYKSDRTENLLWRIENGEMDGYEAKCVMLMIGTNNRMDSPGDVALGIRRILDAVARKQPKAKVVLLPIFPCGGPGDQARAKNEKVNAIIKGYADGDKVVWVDFNAKFLNAKGDTLWIMPDRLHPMPKGYEYWLDAVMPHFKRICGK